MIKRILVTAAAAALLAASVHAETAAMPTIQQNALVAKYCTVCHTGAHPNGRLSLEHFDAAHPDPGVAAMMAAKLRTGAFGASGQPLPDKETQDALLSALTAESAGATAWTINREKDSVISASIVEQLPSTDKEAHGEPDLYRLSITCNTFTRKGEMLLAWSPGVPKDGRIMSAAVDGKAPVTYKVEGTETMGNGQKGSSGPGAILLDATALPDQTLTISNAFPDETVVFPIGKLDQEIRHSLAACFMLRIVP